MKNTVKKEINQLQEIKGCFSNDKTIELFKQYKQDKLKGVPLENIESRTLLIMGNRRLVFYVLKKEFEIDGECEDTDEFDEAQIGLVKAVDSYNINRDVKFSSYAYNVIANEVRRYYIKKNSQSNYAENSKIYLEDLIESQFEDSEPVPGVEILKSDEDVEKSVVDQIIYEKIIKNLHCLSAREQYAVIHYLGLFGNSPKNQQEIANGLKVSRAYVGAMYNSGLKKLRILYSEDHELTKEQRIMKQRMLKKNKDRSTQNLQQ